MRRAFITALIAISPLALLHAQEWGSLATISTTTIEPNHVCYTDSTSTDIVCGDRNIYIQNDGTISATSVSATTFYGSGANLTDIPATAVDGLSLDRIVSNTTSVIAGEDGSIHISGTVVNISGTVTLDAVAGGNGISQTLIETDPEVGTVNDGMTCVGDASGRIQCTTNATSYADNLGNHTATEALKMANNGISATTAIDFDSTGNEECGAAQLGTMRFNPTSERFELCRTQ